MIQAGAIQVIPGSGGQLGQIIATRALLGSGSQPPTNGSGGTVASAPQTLPAAVALVPLSSTIAATQAPANGPSARAEQANPSQSSSTGDRQPAPSPAPAQTAPVNSAASVVTIIQQLDPRDIHGATPDEANTQSPAQRQQQEREATPENARQPTSNPALLTASEREIVRELSARDAIVRTEEESHQTLAGANAGMISYSYTAGPDGRLYATGGKVSIRPIQGLDGVAAIANQAAISRAASVPGSSAADFNVAKGASKNISAMIASQASAAAESYRMTLGLNAAPGKVDLSG
ncbi:putative metalloprotease CJM1_0395 family protein [Thalassospira sp. UBA1131]|uniref:putative metalloprotease CJM1_0395 family protein n=1 Tax=Thalassospira sp. UBA1131 TaxID=1947672 RepID=UPI0025DCC8DC|nr:putative metalloprotease CJM1_0395 family protein [Thalassospira sp. UBA1131]